MVKNGYLILGLPCYQSEARTQQQVACREALLLATCTASSHSYTINLIPVETSINSYHPRYLDLGSRPVPRDIIVKVVTVGPHAGEIT